MNEEIILDKLRKMLFTTQQANECGLSNNDFKEDIHVLSGAIGLIENLIQRNKGLEEKVKEYTKQLDLDYVENNYISKSKIKEKLNQIHEEYQKILESNRSLQDKNICTFQHGAMRTVLEELL